MSDYPCTWLEVSQGKKIPMPPFVTEKGMETLTSTFESGANDVFVVTFPRSGTTWTEQIVHLLINGGDQGTGRLTDAAPWLETLPNRPQGVDGFLDGMNGRRLFTSHLPYAMMPGFSNTKGRYIYVARNPKDVAVSYYYHDCSKHGYKGRWEEHFDRFCRGEVMYGSYFDHVLPWWKAAQKMDNILFLKYEDMKRDLVAAVQQIARFIGVLADQKLVDQVVEKSTFQNMASNPATNFEWVEQQEGVPTHYRKGVVGDWRSHFSKEQNKRFDRLYQTAMEGTELQFNFGKGLILP